jgi:predicted metal-dependent hydrolase
VHYNELMATKTIELAGVGQVQLVKRAGSRSLRLSVTPSGVRVSMPHWTPYAAGQAFALGHLDWIRTEQAKLSRPLLASGHKIGKMHTLRFEQTIVTTGAGSRVTATEVIVRVAPGEAVHDTAVQARAHLAATRALKREANRLLPPRLNALAAQHGKEYSSVTIKHLKRRWGSCDNHQAIALNLFLMELPWDYIDYVLLHELAHTVEMNHGPEFWKILTAMQPRARDLAKQLRKRQPTLGAWG